MRHFSERSKQNLRGVHPDLQAVISAALQSAPMDFIVIEGVRSIQRQRELVASGASQTMNSRHITGHAVDLLPIGPNGPAFDWPLYNKLGPHVKEVAARMNVDLEWGGDWVSFKDGPHFQLSREAYPPEDWTTGDPAPAPKIEAVLEDADKPPHKSKSNANALLQFLTGQGANVLAYIQGMDWKVVAVIAVAGAAFLAFQIWDRERKAVLARVAKGRHDYPGGGVQPH